VVASAFTLAGLVGWRLLDGRLTSSL